MYVLKTCINNQQSTGYYVHADQLVYSFQSNHCLFKSIVIVAK